MFNLNKLGDFKVRGAVGTQFHTSLAVERVMIGMGEKVGGITSFLASIEFIGYILLIGWSLVIICTILLVNIVLFLASIYKHLYTSKSRREAYEKELATDKQIAENIAKFELTEEDEEEIRNFN